MEEKEFEIRINEEFELRLTTTLAPMLLVIGTFSLTVVGLQESPKKIVLDEIFSALGAICFFGASLVIDSALDKQKLDTLSRFKLLSGGYFLFCVAIGIMSTAIPILYETKRSVQSNLLSDKLYWDKTFIIYIAAGVTSVIKLMVYEESGWTIAMFLLYVMSIFILWR